MMDKRVFLAVFFLSIWLSVSSQTPHFQPYFLLKKNEPVQVNTIFQDNTGFIWYGTNKGLFKFNGKNYVHFTKADSLPDDNVTAIAQDAEGKLWTGHKNGTLAFFRGGKFTLFDPAEGAAAASISDILFDKSGVMWFSTRNDGLYYYTRGRLFRLDEQEGMPDLFVYDLMEDPSGNVWAGTDGGVVICSLNKSGRVDMNVLNYEDGLADNIVKKLAPGQDNTVWMATEDAGLVHYNPQSKLFTKPAKFPYTTITDFVIDGKKVWIATAAPGLILSDTENGKYKYYGINTPFNPGAIGTLMKDREGNIWAGSKTGLVRTSGSHFAFIESFGSSRDVNVLAVAVDKAGDIWYSTSEGLFKRSITESGEVLIKGVMQGTRFQNYRVISLYADGDGYLWAGLYGQGALRLNTSTNKVVTHLNKEIRNGNILNITGKGNTVWLATLGGGEQINISGEKLVIKNYSRQNGLSSDFIYQVFVDGGDRVWFATDGKGVDMLDDEGIHHFEDGLSSKVVYGFAEDGKHKLWVNVQGSGVYRLENSQFVAMDSSLQLRDNNINCLSADQAGNLVFMHDLGIDVLDINKNRIRYFNEDTGIRNKRATLNAVARDDRGNLFVGTDEGIIQYVSNEIFTGAEPRIAIDAFKVFDQRIDLKESVVLKYDENSVTINFSGLWYQHPESLNFLYKMDNYDEGWIRTGDNAVTYSRLPAGDYTFTVKVSDNHDFNHAHAASVKFTIKPPFWQTPLFYGICVVALVSGIYTVIKVREKKLLHDKQVLEAKVEERTRELQLKTEEIQAQNEEIMAQAEEINGINENLEMLVKERTAELEKKNKALEEYAFINAHKLRSPLASILGLIHLLTKMKLDDETKIINEHLRQRADELDEVVRSITEAIERGERKEYKRVKDED